MHYTSLKLFIYKLGLIIQKMSITITNFYIKYKLYIWISCAILGGIGFGVTCYAFYINYKKAVIIASLANSTDAEQISVIKSFIKAIKLHKDNTVDFIKTYMPETNLRDWFNENFLDHIRYDDLERPYYIVDREVADRYLLEHIELDENVVDDNFIYEMGLLDPEGYNAHFLEIEEADRGLEIINYQINQISEELLIQQAAQESLFILGTAAMFIGGCALFSVYKIITIL